MKKILFCMGVIFVAGSKAQAYTINYEVYNSTAVCNGVTVSASAATQVDGYKTQIAGYLRGYLRVSNQDTTNSIWCAPTSGVVITSNVLLGEKIVAGGNAVFPFGKDISLYCKAENSSVVVSVLQVGYK